MFAENVYTYRFDKNRMSTITSYVANSIIERGTHHMLMSEDTEYKALWNLQHTADEWSIDRRQE